MSAEADADALAEALRVAAPFFHEAHDPCECSTFDACHVNVCGHNKRTLAAYDALAGVLDRSTPMHSATCAGQDDEAPCICGTAGVIEAAHDVLAAPVTTTELAHRHVDGWCLACMTEGGRLALNMRRRQAAPRRTHARGNQRGVGIPLCGIGLAHGGPRPGYRPPELVPLAFGDQADVTCGLCRRILRSWRP